MLKRHQQIMKIIGLSFGQQIDLKDQFEIDQVFRSPEFIIHSKIHYRFKSGNCFGTMDVITLCYNILKK